MFMSHFFCAELRDGSLADCSMQVMPDSQTSVAIREALARAIRKKYALADEPEITDFIYEEEVER